MDLLLKYALLILSIANFTNGLLGPNVCNEKQNYTLTTRVKYHQPVSVRTYTWCFDIPPKCSSVHTEMRERWKVQTETREKNVYFCCPGFVENEEKCNPKCSEGVTGNNCNQDCPPDKWGVSCSQDCRCPRNSVCDPKNGKCICMDGWAGSSCNVPKEVFTRVPLLQTSSTKSKEQKPLFDWSTPIETRTIRPYTSTLRIPITPSFLTTQSTPFLPTDNIKLNITTITSTTEANNNLTITSATSNIMKITTVNALKLTTSQPSVIENNSTIIINENESPKKDVTASQIESPVSTFKTISSPSVTDSPITVILHNISKIPTKDAKQILKATESSIISLTVLKSTVISPKKKIQKTTKSKQGDSELVKITLFSTNSDKTSTTSSTILNSLKDHVEMKSLSSNVVTTRPVYLHRNNTVVIRNVTKHSSTVIPPVITVSHLDNNTFFTMITTDIQTEEVKHVLTEPEQITSVADDGDDDERKDDLYSALSIGMGVTVALILVATIIVFVARYRRSCSESDAKMDMDRIQSIMSVSEDEVPSSYLRSVFHSPLPDSSSPGIHESKIVPFMSPAPVLLHTISPMLMESFKEVLECHYDHPKPPRPASLSITTTLHQNNVSFGTLPSSFRPQMKFDEIANHVNTNEICFPVTEEAIDALKFEKYKTHTLEMECLEPIYDEIPWRPITATATEIINNHDEAVTEL
ncbi:uncharacterized protein LOC143917223 [Arctopsyche grandis]|uniref:uncharacterized protein LOC143917223 n=1 Tax=Arctopsyche grandis TaxID=121162 RepID=UPI00406D7322